MKNEFCLGHIQYPHPHTHPFPPERTGVGPKNRFHEIDGIPRNRPFPSRTGQPRCWRNYYLTNDKMTSNTILLLYLLHMKQHRQKILDYLTNGIRTSNHFHLWCTIISDSIFYFFFDITDSTREKILNIFWWCLGSDSKEDKRIRFPFWIKLLKKCFLQVYSNFLQCPRNLQNSLWQSQNMKQDWIVWLY